MLKIGLTGGIGAGKSTVAGIFKVLGVPVFDADATAKNILNTDSVLREQIAATFGSETYKNGLLDKKYLATLVFNNPDQLKLLNQIIHPAVKIDFKKWLNANKNSPLVIKEAAILFESGSYKDCDAIISISAPQEMRIQRVIERDHLTYEEVMSRINNQWTDEMRKNKSDYIIDNQNIKKACTQTENTIKKLLNY